MKLFKLQGRAQTYTTNRIDVALLRSLGVLKVQLIIAMTLLIGSSTGCKSESSKFGDILGSADGGIGSASIAISSFSPGATSPSVKTNQTQDFIVAAVGRGTLSYTWTLDGSPIGGNSPTLTINGANYSPGTRTLRVVIADQVGTVSQSWNLKINGKPVVSTSSPSGSNFAIRKVNQASFSVTMTDPNSDTLTYKWFLNGNLQSTFTSNSFNWTPTALEVGTHTVKVEVYDGTEGEPGTWMEPRQWTVNVNNFHQACNKMDMESLTNRACVYIGIPGIGDGDNVANSPTNFMLQPRAIEATSVGNWFVADGDGDVVFFYNRVTSPSITIFGIEVPIGTAKVVAGSGFGWTATETASTHALRSRFNDINGLLWDGTQLFLTDSGNNRIVKIDGSTGTVTDLNLSSLNCQTPAGLARIDNTLYIACSARHTILAHSISGNSSSLFAGTDNTAGDPADFAGYAFTNANARLRNPWGILATSTGNLIVTENGACRVRYYNIATAAGVTLMGGNAIAQNQTRIIAGPRTGGCAAAVTDGGTGHANGSNGTAVFRGLRTPAFVPDTNEELLLLPQDTIGRVHALNLSGSTSYAFPGVTPNVTAGSVARVIGLGTTGNNPGYNGHGALANASSVNQVMDIHADPVSKEIYLADFNNRRLRKIASSDNFMTLVFGNGQVRSNTNAGQGSTTADAEKMSNPRGFVRDSVTGEIFIADSLNHRIRVMTTNGIMSQAVGTGTAGTGTEEDVEPSNTTMNQPRGLALIKSSATYGGHLVWADSQNHRVRVWNRSSSSDEVFGVTIAAGKVETVAGNGTAGNFWQVSQGVALGNASLNQPSGVAWDGTDLYISDYTNHCVKKLLASGTDKGKLQVVAGDCDQVSGVAGQNDGAVGVATLNFPNGLTYYSNGTQKGLVIASLGSNGGHATASRVKYLRLEGTGSIFGRNMSIGSAASIACGDTSPGTDHVEDVGGINAVCSGVFDVTAFGSLVCWANSAYSNVRCISQTNSQVYTVMGPPQGTAANAAIHYPGNTYTSADSTTTPVNPGYQNGVPAFVAVDPAAALSVTTPHGQLNLPRSLMLLDASSLLVSDYTGTVRKVRLRTPTTP